MQDHELINTSIKKILNSKNATLLKVERETVNADEVFHNTACIESLRAHSMLKKTYESSAIPPECVARINGTPVPDGYISEKLSHQDISAKDIAGQAKMIAGAPFLKSIASHPEFISLPGFEKQLKIFIDTPRLLNLFRNFENLFRKNKLSSVLGSNAELKIADICFGKIWPGGVNLYQILRELYPAFHARVTGQIPLYVASNMDELLQYKLPGKKIRGIGKALVDNSGRFFGLYPVVSIPEDEVSHNAVFVSQDQVCRRAIVETILEDIIKLIKKNKNRNIFAIDYAGGVGNLSELLLKRIYTLPSGGIRNLLMNQVKCIVIDIAGDQLSAGENRFNQMSRSPKYTGIHEKVIFIKGDVTRKLSRGEIALINKKFQGISTANSICIGMTSYTVGALDNLHDTKGTSFAHSMADVMMKQCWKIYAVDFSSPMWREKAFLKDTKEWGTEYMRTLHGVHFPHEQDMPLKKVFSILLRIRHGLKFKSVSRFVKFMALGPGLASHYSSVWPDTYGHNSGYSIMEDSTLKMPGILSFGDRLSKKGASVKYKSRVWLVAGLDLGKTDEKNRAWALIPGWVSDFIIAENSKNRPD